MAHPKTLNGEVHTKNFSGWEFRCKCDRCKRMLMNHMLQRTANKLQEMREMAGRPLVLNSAWRCELHEDEASKATPGQHNKGTAFDIRVANGVERMEIVRLALLLGATGIGVAKTFVHVDFRRTNYPVMWRYS